MFQDIFIMISVLFIAMMSPGPDMLLILKYSVSHRKLPAVFCIFGIAAGLTLHIALAIFGISAIIISGGIYYQVLKFCGALYLCYVGYKTFQSAKTPIQETKNTKNNVLLQSFKEGFLTNTSNPKVVIFILSLFTQIITPETHLPEKIFLSIVLIIAVLIIWNAFALLMRQKTCRSQLIRHHIILNQIIGLMLIAFGLTLGLIH